MTSYKCDICNFESKLKANYTRHILSEKHKLLYENKKLSSLEVFYCNTCKFKTIKKSDYKRHLLTNKHLKINTNNNLNKSEYNDKKLEELKLEIQKLKDTNNQNTNKIVKEARKIKSSMLTMLNTHFKDTPSIEYIEQQPFFVELEKEYNAKINDGSDKLFMKIFMDYEKKKLVKTLSDLILKLVKKDQQKFQSVFNIDSARLNFATKVDDFWLNDKKGLQLRKFTIDKVVSFMIDVLEVFRLRLVKMRNENIKKSTVERSDYLMTYQKLLFEVVSFLNSPNTHTKIITQLSPNLRCDEQLLLN